MVDGALEFRILGPFEVLRDGQPVPLGGPRQRAVLARLIVDPGHSVSADRLVDDVWDGCPPATAAKTLQKYISELRKAVGRDLLRTTAGGYLVETADLDASRFERLVKEGGATLAAGDPGTAARLLVEADALWRGRVLADLGDAGFVAAERNRLEDRRLVGLEARFEAELDLGRHAAAVAELAELVEQHPLRERVWSLFVRALYGSGRQAEALRAFERYRRLLAEELGLEPSPELRALEGAMLRHDVEVVPARGSIPGNLPTPVTSFVGRDALLELLLAGLCSHRLVTLTGPGGVGKTRSALQVAERSADQHPGGVWMVDLAPTTDAASVVRAVSSALGVEERQGEDLREGVIAALCHRRPTLLLLDNCEHVVPGCAALAAAVLQRCPNARILATSRHPLGVNGECVRSVPPLTDDEAVELFTVRADLAPSGFELTDDNLPSVGHICRQLDGLPLAIELAAGQIRVLEPGEIAARLDDRFAILAQASDASPRQRTLLATVEWSHDLLSPAAQQVFARLGVFSGSFTLEAAEAVCSGRGVAHRDVLGLITELVDHSMLVREAGPPSVARYRLLDTLRLYARQQLAQRGEVEVASRSHSAFVLRLGRAADPHFYGPGELVWRARLQAEDHNLWGALDWARQNDGVLAHRLAAALWRYWDVRWFERDALTRLEPLLAADDPRVPAALRAWVLTVAADLAANAGDARAAAAWAESAVPVFRRLHDQNGLACAQMALGYALGNGAFLDRAARIGEAALEAARSLCDARLEAKAFELLGFVATRHGDLEAATRYYVEALEIWRQTGSVRGCAGVYRRLGALARDSGDLDKAEKLCLEAFACVETLDDPAALAHLRLTLADVARLRDDRDGATQLYGDALGELRHIGDRRCIASTYKNLAIMALTGGEPRDASDLFLDSIRLRHALGDDPGLAECLDGLAAVALAEDDVGRAITLLAAAESQRQASHAAATAAERVTITALVEDARERSRACDFTTAWNLGMSFTADDAVHYASS